MSALASPRRRRSQRTPVEPKVPVPTTAEAWLKECAAAYADAHETIPFGPLAGVRLAERDLFHLAPVVCLKFRGIRASKAALKRATDAALASYVAMRERNPELLSRPTMAFAFCYVAAHFGLDLLTEEQASATLDYIEIYERRRP